MSFFNKTYILDRDENLKEFLEHFNVPEDQIKVMCNFKPVHMLKKDGDEYILSMTTPGGDTEVKFKDGVEFDEEPAPGYFAKSIITIEGNVIVHSQRFGEQLTIIFRREYSGDKFVMEMTTNEWDGVARRYFIAV